MPVGKKHMILFRPQTPVLAGRTIHSSTTDEVDVYGFWTLPIHNLKTKRTPPGLITHTVHVCYQKLM